MMTSPLTEQEQKQWILRQINVDKTCEVLYKQTMDVTIGPTKFVERIEWLASQYERDEKINCRPSVACAECEFRATAEEESRGLKNGFKECWKQALNWTDKDFETPNVLNIWDYKRKGKLLAENRIAMSEVMKTDIEPDSDGKPGLSHSERQWLQVEKVQNRDNTICIEKAALKREMQRWKFPLHFIDFETAAVAIPFNEGRRPYEQVAFQFSHHMVHQDGRIEHKGQYLNIERGVFPNYDFVRALKKELEDDDGSIFRYAAHENTMLVAIDGQLAKDSQPPKDMEALKRFIRSITNSTKKSVEKWRGERSMIDLREMVLRYYYAPSTNGSNSIKTVLPALLKNSDYLKKKYSQPIYGGKGQIHSLNFQNKVWIKMEGGHVIDPYKRLPKMFSDVSDHDFKYLSEDDELRDGVAAMTAYALMQFEEMGDTERHAIREALLRYCELDTLAMVMIYEAWADLVK